MKQITAKTIMLRILSAIITLIIVVVLCCTLSACDPGDFRFKEEDLSEVVSVELIDYDNPTQRKFISWVPDHSSDLLPFDKTKMTVLETLDDAKISDFIDELCEYHILYLYYSCDSPNGKCLKLNYSNGDFIIVHCNYPSFSGYIGKYNSDGEVVEFYGSFDASGYFKSLINNYFQNKLSD